jgi:hypothetical protein
MKLKWIITCLAIICFTNRGLAQQTNRVSLQYSVGFPTSNLKHYVSQTSFRGFEFGYRYLLTSNVGLGIDAGMNTFYEKERGTFREGTSAITGNQYRYANNFPILASFSYYIKPDQTLNPYVNLGVGTLYTRRDTDIGLYRSETEAWQFNLKPEVGLIYLINPGLGVKISGKYHYAFESDELQSQSFAAVGLGIVFSGSR